MFKFKVNGAITEIFYVCVTLLVYALVGITRSYISFLFHQLDAPDSPIPLDDDQKSWIASLATITCPLGCFVSGTFMDIFGRKYSIQLSYIPFIGAWMLLSVAKNVMMLYMVAIIQGIGLGMSFCVSTYISEIASAKIRGALIGMLQLNFNFGILLSNILMYYFNWTTVAVILAVITFFWCALTLILPESPTWLYLRGRKSESLAVLNSLRDQNSATIKQEIEDLEKYCETKKHTSLKENILQCFKYWKPLVLVTLIFTLSLNTGFTSLLSFSIMILDCLHIPGESAKLAVVFSLVGAGGSIVTPILLHKFNRKTMLITSSLGMGISLLIIAIYEENFTHSVIKSYAWILPSVFYFYSFASVLGVTVIGFILGSEFFPNEVRGTLNGIYGTLVYICWAALNKYFPYFLSTYGVKAIVWTFSGSCFVLVLFIAFTLPETRGKTLNEIQEKYFKRKPSVRVNEEKV